MSFPVTVLSDRAVVEVSGPDAEGFLQGLITNDAGKASEGAAVYAALLTPQGKILGEFLVLRTEGGLLLDCAADRAGDLASRLQRYRLRARLTISLRPDLGIVASPDPIDGGIPDPRLETMGYRAVRRKPAPGGDLRLYHLHRILQCVPDSTDIPPETAFPLDCNFEELHGIDFAKGCYVGQELTARMKHRATARKRILRITSAAQDLPAFGTPLLLEGTEIGELRGSIGNQGLASVRLDRLGQASHAAALGLEVDILRPPYPLVLGA